MKRYGTEYGGFYIPVDIKLDQDSIVYSFGVGEDVSFDVEIAGTFNCNVYLFDPTPRSFDHLELINDCAKKTIPLPIDKRFGGGDPNYSTVITNNYHILPLLAFYDYGVHTYTGYCDFFMPANSEFVSHTMEPLMAESTKSFSVPVRTIKTIMTILNHDHIDLLKIDIEGIELEIIDYLLNNKIYPKVLCVDFDVLRKKIKRDYFQQVWDRLLKFYKLVSFENMDATFVLI